MRCVECHRLVEKAAGQCPYCGSNVLTPADRHGLREFSTHAHSIWDQTDPANNVIRFPFRDQEPRLSDICISSIVLTGFWVTVVWWMDWPQTWQVWLAGGVAILSHAIVLFLLESPPLWRWVVNKFRSDDQDIDDESVPPANVSNL